MKEDKPTVLDYAKELFGFVPEDITGSALVGRAVLYVVLLVWGLGFIFHSPESNYAIDSIMHYPNLIFHESGHIVFSVFGDFMQTLGGSLMQLLIPLLVFLAFLLRVRDNFAASVGLWWFSQSCMDLAPYIYDARRMQLMLNGGITGEDAPDYHDWQNLLYRLQLERYDHALANSLHVFAAVLMLAAFVWGAYILYKQYRVVKGQA